MQNYTSDDDTLMLEDESGRLPLSGAALPVHNIATGMVVALHGVLSPQGVFEVPPSLTP